MVQRQFTLLEDLTLELSLQPFSKKGYSFLLFISKNTLKKMSRKNSNFCFKKRGNKQHYRKAVVESSLISSFTCLEINVKSYCKPHWVHTTASEKNLKQTTETDNNEKIAASLKLRPEFKAERKHQTLISLSISIPDLNLLRGFRFSTL